MNVEKLSLLDEHGLQALGSEFIVSFYTFMYKEFESLSHFYREDATVSYEGTQVKGRDEIHQLFLEKNLDESRVYILRMDVLKSVAGTVLIQVSGEQNTKMSKSRRFMQSFILTEESQGNFLILNDIFRYQDTVYTLKYNADGTTELVENGEENGIASNCETRGESTEQSENNEVCEWDGEAEESETTEDTNIEVYKRPILTEQEQKEIEARDKGEILEDESYGLAEDGKDNTIEGETKNDEPISWVNILKSTAGKPTANVAPQPQIPIYVRQEANQENVEKPNNNNAPEKPKPRYNEQYRNRQRQSADFTNNPSRGLPNIPDNCQVFVGNMPLTLDEETLKNFFNRYGKVVDAKINKSVAKYGKPLPNFGFVGFTTPEPVAKLLALKPIMFGNHRLNVEEKKAGGVPPRNASRGGDTGKVRVNGNQGFAGHRNQ